MLKLRSITAPIDFLLRKYIEKVKKPTYFYEAKVHRWVDGDTVELIVDVGFYLNFGREDRPISFRLYGMDTPERGKPGFDEATSFVRSMAAVGSTVTIKSVKDKNGKLTDSFGRYIAIVYVDGLKKSLNETLVQEGLAKVSYV